MILEKFIVRLKLKIQNTTVDSSNLAALQNVRALVVESDYNACSSATNLLRRLGMRAEWTMYGNEAVLRVKEAIERHESYGVIVVDDFMMDLDSIDVVRQIRSIPDNGNPIIIMTAYDWTNMEKSAREAGVTDFINKPLFLSEMHGALARAIGVQKEEVKTVKEKEDDFTGMKILLVEDNELNREIAENVLEEMGFVVDYAEDGSVALQKLCAEKPGCYDMILMDVQMPIMDGLETSRRIRDMRDEYFRNVPIIAMTANAFEEDRKAALDAGMNEHVAKPIDVKKLKKVLRKFLK